MATEKFTAEFVERRMRQHQKWQQQEQRRLMDEIIEEVRALPQHARRPRSGFLEFESDPFGKPPRLSISQ